MYVDTSEEDADISFGMSELEPDRVLTNTGPIRRCGRTPSRLREPGATPEGESDLG